MIIKFHIVWHALARQYYLLFYLQLSNNLVLKKSHSVNSFSFLCQMKNITFFLTEVAEFTSSCVPAKNKVFGAIQTPFG